MGRCELGVSGLARGLLAGYCESDNETSGSIKGAEFN